MAKNATIQARVDPETKAEAQSILRALHIPLSEAISMFLKQVVFHKGLPFEVKIPNELTAKTIDKSEAGEDLYTASSVDELLEELDS